MQRQISIEGSFNLNKMGIYRICTQHARMPGKTTLEDTDSVAFLVLILEFGTFVWN